MPSKLYMLYFKVPQNILSFYAPSNKHTYTLVLAKITKIHSTGICKLNVYKLTTALTISVPHGMAEQTGFK